MVFLNHIFEALEHVLTSGYGRYFILVPLVFALLYLILYVLQWGGCRD